jgi:hypothetical protein
MRRPALLLGLLLLVVFAPVARADTVAVLPSVGPDQDTHEADISPVITADGSIVLAVESTPTRIDIVRLAPGTQEPQVVETVPTVEGRNAQYQGPSTSLYLLAAGQGFFLHRIDRAPGAQWWESTVLRNSLEWFPSPSGPGSVIASCDGGCGVCPDALRPLAADADHAIIATATCGAGGRLKAVIRDLVTGEERRFRPPWPISAGNRFSGSASAIVGRFAAGRGGVMDWTNGRVLHQVAYMGSPGLLADGTLIYSKLSSPASRLGPDDIRATALPVTGSIQAVTRGVILTFQSHSLSTWNADGGLTGTLNAFEDYGAVGSWAFDGTRVVYPKHFCLFVRVTQWSIDGTVPASPAEYCDRAVPAGSVTVGPKQARLVVACPADSRVGCVGSVRTAVPFRKARTYSLHAGEHREVTLVSGLGPASCRKLAAPTWKVEVLPNDLHGYPSDQNAVYQDVGTVNACGRKR